MQHSTIVAPHSLPRHGTPLSKLTQLTWHPTQQAYSALVAPLASSQWNLPTQAFARPLCVPTAPTALTSSAHCAYHERPPSAHCAHRAPTALTERPLHLPRAPTALTSSAHCAYRTPTAPFVIIHYSYLCTHQAYSSPHSRGTHLERSVSHC